MATRTVTLATDNNVTGSQPGELRYEIANAVPGETVEIALGVDPQLSPLGAITGGGQIFIDKDVTIQGQGADETAITVPTLTSRVFMIGSTDPTAVVTIRDVRLSGGHASNGAAGSGAPGGNGGAIHTNAVLTLDQVELVLNSAGNGGSGAVGTNGTGGGTGGTGGAGGFGGGVFNQVGGVLTVIDSTFEDNWAGDGGTGGKGGNGSGMFAIAGNGGPGGLGRDGGAIHNTGALSVTNSTFFGNESGQGGTGGDKGDVGGLGQGGNGGDGGDGAAIHQGGAGSVTLTHSTIAGNTAKPGGQPGTGAVGFPTAGADGTGGGTFLSQMVTVANTLYSQNTATSGSNCAGPAAVTSQGANLSFPAGDCPPSFSNGNPQLGLLEDNGGPTRTMALGGGSAAINQVAVGAPNCPGADQRGIARPQGPTCDIGAFEVQMAAPPPPVPAPPPPVPAPLQVTPTALGAAPAAKKKCKKAKKKSTATKSAAASKKRKCAKKKRKK